MIDFVTLRNYIRKGLQAYLRNEDGYEEILVVQFNPDAPEPPKPYLTMNFTSPFIPGGVEIEEVANKGDDVQYTRYSNDTMSSSWNVYSDDIDEAHKIALMAQRWFIYDGRDYLKGKDIVVVEWTGIQNRDIFVVDAWERRLGFDTIFRVLSKIEKTVSTIETVDIKECEDE